MAQAVLSAQSVLVAAPAAASLRSSRRALVRSTRVSNTRARLTIRAGKEENTSKIEEITRGAESLVEGVKERAAELTGTSKKGVVREITNANVSADAQTSAGKAVTDVGEAIEGAIDTVKNALGGDEGYDSKTQRGAFTTPNREAMKAKYNPSKDNKQPPQKTVDLANPFDKK